MFERLLGQESIKRTLSEAVNTGRYGHAYVFCGPDGIGRKSFARELARGVMCTGPDGTEKPCGNCPSCRFIAAGTNPDFKLISGDENRASIGVEYIRRLEEDIATAPTVSAKKVYVIDRSEKLTVEAQNALLKTIEEPPEYVMLILICSNPSMLIDTVRSRVIRLDFARYSREDVLAAYRMAGEASGITAEEEDFIVSYADGIIGRGLLFKDFGLYGKLRERIFDVLSMLGSGKGKAGTFYMEFIALFTDKDNLPYKDFLFFELTAIVRDVMIFARTGSTQALQNRQFGNKIEELAKITGRHGWEKIVDAVTRAYPLTVQNVNQRMIAANLAAQIIDAAGVS